MATRQIIHHWCDRCLIVDEYVEAPTIHVHVPDVGMRMLELCEADQKELPYLEVVDLAKHNGRESQATSDTRPTCLECGKQLKNRTTLRAHLRNKHGLKVAEYEERRSQR